MRNLLAFSERLRHFEKYVMEVVLALCSLWASVVFFQDPISLADTYGNYFALLSQLHNSAQVWGFVTGLAAIFLFWGLFVCLYLRQPEMGLIFRCLGLGLTGTFWALAGVSALLAHPASIGGITMTLLGFSAWWILLRFPSVPQDEWPSR